MSSEISERSFEEAIEQALLQYGPDAYVGDANAVQTLSRLNRTHPEKKGAMVLDFANEADEIKAAFEPYYETTLLSEATDPNLLYEIQTRLSAFPVYTQNDVEAFARVFYYDAKATQNRLYAALAPVAGRFGALSAEEQPNFRGQLTDYVRLTFDQKVEHVIQEIVDSNFELYKRITDDHAFGEAIKNLMFDHYLLAHRNAEVLIKAGESKTL
ncbi:MAG: hypothetical protein AB1547_09030 [Thermodesulfobacteriota bacterium]